jgi:hypothetical protein
MVMNREPDGIFGRRGFGMWETDAYLLVITRSIGKGNDAVERMLLVEGSHVHYVGQVYWDSLSESYVLFHSESLPGSEVGGRTAVATRSA